MRRNRANNLVAVVAMALLVLSSCAEKRREGTLPDAKLEALLYDYHLAQVMVSDLPSSQRYKKELYFNYLYEKHGVTKAEVDSTLLYYARKPEGLSKIYVSLSKRIENDLKHLAEVEKPVKVREAVSVVGDSADLWYDVRFVEMNASPLKGNRYHFTIPTDTNFKSLDHIVWGGEVLFLGGEVDSLHRFLHLDLKVTYNNDSIVSADTLLYHSGQFSMEVSNSALLRSIDGTAYFKSSRPDERILLLSPSLMRYRHRAKVSGCGASLVNDSLL